MKAYWLDEMRAYSADEVDDILDTLHRERNALEMRVNATQPRIDRLMADCDDLRRKVAAANVTICLLRNLVHLLRDKFKFDANSEGGIVSRIERELKSLEEA